MSSNVSDSSGTGDSVGAPSANPAPLFPPLAQLPQSTGVDFQPPSIEEYSLVGYSAEESNGEIDTSKIKKSTVVEMSTSQMENSVEKSSGEIDASKIEQSAETKKDSEMEKEKLRRERDELISRESTDFIRQLDPTGAVSLMFLASPVYAMLAVLPLWLVADKPQALLWTFAHLACFFMFLWIITLSTTRISTVFFRITYIFLLACTVVHLIGPVNGMLSLYAGMIYVAGMLGYAVAEHLHLTGFEQTASALCTTQFNSKDFKERALIMCFTTVVMTTPILARMAWVFLVPYSVRHMTRMDVLAVVVELTSEIFVVGALWIVYMLDFFLGGALVSMEKFSVTAIICWVACCSLALLCSFKIAEAVGMLVLWLGWMALGGFYGYCLGLRACYCKMLTGSDSTGAAKEQNGGTQ